MKVRNSLIVVIVFAVLFVFSVSFVLANDHPCKTVNGPCHDLSEIYIGGDLAQPEMHSIDINDDGIIDYVEETSKSLKSGYFETSILSFKSRETGSLIYTEGGSSYLVNEIRVPIGTWCGIRYVENSILKVLVKCNGYTLVSVNGCPTNFDRVKVELNSGGDHFFTCIKTL